MDSPSIVNWIARKLNLFTQPQGTNMKTHPDLRIFFFAAFCLVVLLSGCGREGEKPTSSDGKAETVNKICPIMGNEVDPSVTTAWNGKTVGFCCAECIPDWKKLSDQEKDAKLAKADKAGTSK